MFFTSTHSRAFWYSEHPWVFCSQPSPLALHLHPGSGGKAGGRSSWLQLWQPSKAGKAYLFFPSPLPLSPRGYSGHDQWANSAFLF